MKKKTITAALVAAASLGWISVAAAQGPEGGPMRRPGGPGFGPGGPGRPPGPPIEMVAEELGLSDDQRAQWKSIHEKARDTGEPLMKAAGAAKEAFDKALGVENADPATVGHAAIAMRNAHLKVQEHHKATLEAVKATLTPEQLAQFEEREKRRPEGAPHQGFRQGGPQRRRGPGGK